MRVFVSMVTMYVHALNAYEDHTSIRSGMRVRPEMPDARCQMPDAHGHGHHPSLHLISTESHSFFLSVFGNYASRAHRYRSWFRARGHIGRVSGRTVELANVVVTLGGAIHHCYTRGITPCIAFRVHREYFLVRP